MEDRSLDRHVGIDEKDGLRDHRDCSLGEHRAVGCGQRSRDRGAFRRADGAADERAQAVGGGGVCGIGSGGQGRISPGARPKSDHAVGPGRGDGRAGAAVGLPVRPGQAGRMHRPDDGELPDQRPGASGAAEDQRFFEHISSFR